jgi:hypothetical protein
VPKKKKGLTVVNLSGSGHSSKASFCDHRKETSSSKREIFEIRNTIKKTEGNHKGYIRLRGNIYIVLKFYREQPNMVH